MWVTSSNRLECANHACCYTIVHVKLRRLISSICHPLSKYFSLSLPCPTIVIRSDIALNTIKKMLMRFYCNCVFIGFSPSWQFKRATGLISVNRHCVLESDIQSLGNVLSNGWPIMPSSFPCRRTIDVDFLYWSQWFCSYLLTCRWNIVIMWWKPLTNNVGKRFSLGKRNLFCNWKQWILASFVFTLCTAKHHDTERLIFFFIRSFNLQLLTYRS